MQFERGHATLIQNIQTLFNTIRAEQVCAYLSLRGWRLRAAGERLDFDKCDEATGESRTLFLPASETHPKFRRLLPNLIFSLATLENREALDIANEISSSSTPTTAYSPQPVLVPKSVSARVNARFRNIDAATAHVTVSGLESSWKYALPPGEEVWVELNSSTTFDIGFSGQLNFSTDASNPSAVLLGLPSRLTRRTTESCMEWLRQRFADHFDLSSDVSIAWLSSTERLVARFLFATGQTEEKGLGVCDAETLIRFTAQLSCELAQAWLPQEKFSSALFELTRILLADVGLTFDLDPSNSAMLGDVCRSDDPSSPVQTLAWLKRHTHRIAGEVPQAI